MPEDRWKPDRTREKAFITVKTWFKCQENSNRTRPPSPPPPTHVLKSASTTVTSMQCVSLLESLTDRRRRGIREISRTSLLTKFVFVCFVLIFFKMNSSERPSRPKRIDLNNLRPKKTCLQRGRAVYLVWNFEAMGRPFNFVLLYSHLFPPPTLNRNLPVDSFG